MTGLVPPPAAQPVAMVFEKGLGACLDQARSEVERIDREIASLRERRAQATAEVAALEAAAEAYRKRRERPGDAKPTHLRALAPAPTPFGEGRSGQGVRYPDGFEPERPETWQGLSAARLALHWARRMDASFAADGLYEAGVRLGWFGNLETARRRFSQAFATLVARRALDRVAPGEYRITAEAVIALAKEMREHREHAA